MLNTFSNWLTEVLDDLACTSQRQVVTEAEADELPFRLRQECVGRMLADRRVSMGEAQVRKSITYSQVRETEVTYGPPRPG